MWQESSTSGVRTTSKGQEYVQIVTPVTFKENLDPEKQDVFAQASIPYNGARRDITISMPLSVYRSFAVAAQHALSDGKTVHAVLRTPDLRVHEALSSGNTGTPPVLFMTNFEVPYPFPSANG